MKAELEAERAILVDERPDGSLAAIRTERSDEAHRQGLSHATVLFWVVVDTKEGRKIVFHFRSPYKRTAPCALDGNGEHLSGSQQDDARIVQGLYNLERAYL